MGNSCDNCGNAWRCSGVNKTMGCIGWVEMPKRVITNRQWLSTLTDEELAQYLVYGTLHCRLQKEEENYYCDGDCVGCEMKWLQAEHKE